VLSEGPGRQVDKDGFNGKELMIASEGDAKGKVAMLVWEGDEGFEQSIIQPNRDGSYWRKFDSRRPGSGHTAKLVKHGAGNWSNAPLTGGVGGRFQRNKLQRTREKEREALAKAMLAKKLAAKKQ
jgi:hypothetical protein